MTKKFESPDASLILEIRDEGMSAWLTIQPHDRLIDEKEILELLDTAGIKTGFDDAQKYIRENNLEKELGVPFPIAMCNPGSSGTRLRYYFENPSGRILSETTSPQELRDMGYVVPGTVLADHSSNLFDRQGSIYDIFGEIIPTDGVDPEKAHAKAGTAVSYDEEQSAYIAHKAGYPYLDEEGRICLLDSLSIGEGTEIDYPLHTPLSLTYHGSLSGAEIVCGAGITINGDVRDCSLIAEGPIQIWGDVTSSSLTSKDSIMIRGRIVSCENPGINSTGDISFDGAFASRILCRGKIRFEKEISECRVVAEAGITGNSETGTVLSSNVQACGNIDLGCLGNVDGGENELEITISPYYKTMLMLLTRESLRLKGENDPNEARIDELSRDIRNCEAELDFRLNTFLKRSREDRMKVVVHHDVHPIAQIRVLKHSYTIKSYQQGLELYEKE